MIQNNMSSWVRRNAIEVTITVLILVGSYKFLLNHFDKIWDIHFSSNPFYYVLAFPFILSFQVLSYLAHVDFFGLALLAIGPVIFFLITFGIWFVIVLLISKILKKIFKAT